MPIKDKACSPDSQGNVQFTVYCVKKVPRDDEPKYRDKFTRCYNSAAQEYLSKWLPARVALNCEFDIPAEELKRLSAELRTEQQPEQASTSSTDASNNADKSAA